MSNFVTSNSGPLRGTIKVPGDKSISHRSIMLGSIADGVTRVSGFLEGEDSLATLNAFKEMGVKIQLIGVMKEMVESGVIEEVQRGGYRLIEKTSKIFSIIIHILLTI